VGADGYAHCPLMSAGIQKLHIRTVPLGEQPRRICHQSSTKTLGVVTISAAASGPGHAGGSGGSSVEGGWQNNKEIEN
jgi:hypothetical protein